MVHVRGKLRFITTELIFSSKIQVCYQEQARFNWKDLTNHNKIITKRMPSIKTRCKSKQTLVRNIVLSAGLIEIGNFSIDD